MAETTVERIAYLKQYRQETKLRLKQEVVAAYGGCCVCCGESRIEFMTVHHINGGGAQHRKVVGIGHTFYAWLRRQGYPKDQFRILCYNCNMALGCFGYCPHEYHPHGLTDLP